MIEHFSVHITVCKLQHMRESDARRVRSWPVSIVGNRPGMAGTVPEMGFPWP